MAKLRYNRTFKNGIISILFCLLLFGSVLAYSIVAKIQYDGIVSEMESVEATIVDIDWDMYIRGPDEQEIYVTYEVDGVAYSRELKTDTPISFAAGVGAHYSVGDKIDIFYNPQNPEMIASSRSVGVGYFYMVISLIGLAIVLPISIYMIKNSRKFLVTQEEYEKEREALKKSKLARKKHKKKKNAKERKIIKVILIVLAALVGAFILFLLWGALLKVLGY